MSQEAIERFLGRVLTDHEFLMSAVKSLEEACSAEGFYLTPEELRLIKKSDLAQLTTVATMLDNGIKRFSHRNGNGN